MEDRIIDALPSIPPHEDHTRRISAVRKFEVVEVDGIRYIGVLAYITKAPHGRRRRGHTGNREGKPTRKSDLWITTIQICPQKALNFSHTRRETKAVTSSQATLTNQQPSGHDTHHDVVQVISSLPFPRRRHRSRLGPLSRPVCCETWRHCTAKHGIDCLQEQLLPVHFHSDKSRSSYRDLWWYESLKSPTVSSSKDS